MKIIGLNIDLLYGHYNYNVEFNTDVTFIYGKNGCGKTTILNITEIIITGRLYKLFGYKFHSIELLYTINEKENKFKKINIILNKESLDVEFDDRKYKIEHVQMDDEPRTRGSMENETYNYYFNKYDLLNKIKETFNYVYYNGTMN